MFGIEAATLHEMFETVDEIATDDSTDVAVDILMDSDDELPDD